MSPRFVPFGPSHQVAIAVILLVPLTLALFARHEHLGRHADRLTRLGLALFQVAGWLGWYWTGLDKGTLGLDNGLPLNLCDWAEVALVIALLTRNQFAYELGYFWGSPDVVAAKIAPYIEAGVDWISPADYLPVVLPLDEAAGALPRSVAVCERLKALTTPA